jgi:hypothetical protein
MYCIIPPLFIVTEMSIKDRIDALFQAVQSLNAADQMDLTWCVSGKPAVVISDPFDIATTLSVSTNSLEFKQVVRVRLNVDETAKSLLDDIHLIRSESLDIPYLVRLLWSLGFLRLYSGDLISAIEAQIQHLLSSGSPISDSDMIMLLWGDAMLLQTESVLDISLSKVSHFEIPDLVNILFAVTLVGKDIDLIRSLRDTLYEKISRGNYPSDFLVRYNRLVWFTSGVLGEDVESIKRFIIKLKTKAKHRPPWKYTFQLCLASHGILKPKRLEVNALVESVFPFDVSYTTSRRKILLEVTRPDALVREIETLNVIGVDGYTRLCRLALAKLGYHIVNFAVSEWNSEADMEKKMVMIRRRVRNCLKGKRLFTGTERDTAEDEDASGDDGYSDGSDMSY